MSHRPQREEAGITLGRRVGDTAFVNRWSTTQRLGRSLHLYFPRVAQAKGADITNIVDEAYRLADGAHGLAAAVKWANGFTIPQAAVDEDARRLQDAGGCLVTMARRAREERGESRLSPLRVKESLSTDNPEWNNMMEFAVKGVEVLVAKDYIANGVENKPPLRRKYTETKGAVDRMIYEGFREKGLAFILPLSLVEAQKHRIGFIPLSWTTKKDSEEGRNINDASDGGDHGSPLNSDEAKLLGDLKWGVIEHPTLSDIVQMVKDFYMEAQRSDPTVQWTDLRLWKMDLKGAFTLLDFNPENITRVASEMVGELVVFFGCGMFGWTNMPAAFQVVNRAIRWELKQPRVLRGRMTMYSDDMIGVCRAQDAERDMGVARSLCTRLLGDKAVAEKKTEMGRRLTVIGWDIDLDKQLVTISRKNALTALYGYASVDLDKRVPVRIIQRWASWAERYGEICMYMRPFRRVLYGQIQGRLQHTSVVVSNKTKRVIWLYLALLALTISEEDRFTRSLDSFVQRPATLIIQFDGALSGSGVLWYQTGPSMERYGSEARPAQALLGGTAVDLRGLDFGSDATFQNCAEFISALVGLMGALVKGWDTRAIRFIGDSVTALSWAANGRFRSDNVMNAATVFAAICATREVHIMSTELRTSEENWECDMLSRKEPGESWHSLMTRMSRRDHTFQRPMEIVWDMEEILSLCDPRYDPVDENAFGMYWRRVCDAVNRI